MTIEVKVAGHMGGKTYESAYWLIEKALEAPQRNLVLVSDKKEIGAIVDVVFEILKTMDNGPTAEYKQQYGEIKFDNKSTIRIWKTKDIEALRGHQFHAGVGALVEKWSQYEYDSFNMTIRLGEDPSQFLTFASARSEILLDLLELGFKSQVGGKHLTVV